MPSLGLLSILGVRTSREKPTCKKHVFSKTNKAASSVTCQVSPGQDTDQGMKPSEDVSPDFRRTLHPLSVPIFELGHQKVVSE